MIPENKKTEPKRKYTEGKERDHFKYFVKYGEFLPPTKEEIKKAKAPSDWSLIYDSMTPIEKGQWNAEKRKRGMNGKTAEPLNQPKIAKPIKKKPTIEPVPIDFDLDRRLTAGLWSDVVKPTINNPTATAAELGYGGIMEALNLLQSAGMFKKGGKIK